MPSNFKLVPHTTSPHATTLDHYERPTDDDIMMRRQRDISLLRRHVFKSHDPTPSTRRGSTKSREPYILPRLVIDLDANDSQFVREATEEDYAVEPKPPRRRRFDGPAREMVKEQEQAQAFRLNRQSPYAFHTRNITAPDLLAYALLGHPNASPRANNLALRKQFKYHNIYPLDNAHTKIQQLTYNFTTEPSDVLEGAGFLPEQQPQILEQIRACKSFPELHRIITMLSSTAEGCTFLASNGDAIVQGILNCRRSQRSENGPGSTTSSMVLTLLNNLFLSMQSKGVEYGEDLCNIALYYASKTCCLRSMRRYLDISESGSYSASRHTPHSIENLAKGVRRGPAFHTSWTGSMNPLERAKTALELLTGWKSGGVPQPGEERRPCFACIILDRTPTKFRRLSYCNYIGSLGYIGASDALWHEWKNCPEDLFVRTTDLRQKGEIFALAFLMAKDTDSAMSILKTLFEYNSKDGRCRGLRQSPGDNSASWIGFGDFCRHRMKWYYQSNNLIPSEGFKERLNEQFLPDAPATICQAMNDLLVTDWIESMESTDPPTTNTFAHFEIGWVQQDGVEGIAIKEDVDGEEDVNGEILYFKPSSRRISSPNTET